MFDNLTDSKRIQRLQAKVNEEYRSDTLDVKLKLMEILILDELTTAIENRASSNVAGVGLNVTAAKPVAGVSHSGS
jgi:hypothetical protein